MEDLLNRGIDMYSVLHTVCASCDIVVCIHQVHGKNYCEFLKGMLLLFFRSLIWLEPQDMNIRFCYDCMDSILKVEDLNIYVIIK